MAQPSDPKKAVKSGRNARLATALRENLRRRKAQARSRKPPEQPAERQDERDR